MTISYENINLVYTSFGYMDITRNIIKISVGSIKFNTSLCRST